MCQHWAVMIHQGTGMLLRCPASSRKGCQSVSCHHASILQQQPAITDHLKPCLRDFFGGEEQNKRMEVFFIGDINNQLQRCLINGWHKLSVLSPRGLVSARYAFALCLCSKTELAANPQGRQLGVTLQEQEAGG